MGLCQGQSCTKLVKGIVARELGVFPPRRSIRKLPGRRCARPRCMCSASKRRRRKPWANTAETIIIGGGVIGCAAAYYLAKRGMSVIVLEKSDNIGSGRLEPQRRRVRHSPAATSGKTAAGDRMRSNTSGRRSPRSSAWTSNTSKRGNLRLGKNREAPRNPLASCGSRPFLRPRHAHDRRQGSPRTQPLPFRGGSSVASWCPTDGHANPLRTTLTLR